MTPSCFQRPLLALVATLALPLATSGLAQAHTDPATTAQERRVDARQANQAARIQAGVADGRLTGREQAHLQHQQARAARLERRIEADGVVTRPEALHLEQRQDRLSRAIGRQTHDAQRRP